MMKKEILFHAILAVSVSVFFACNSGVGNNAHTPGMGSIAVAPASGSQEWTVSQKDPFNPVNRIESTRKTRPGSFGMILSALPPETLDFDAAGVALNPPGMLRMNMLRLDNQSLTLTSFPFDYENDIAALKSLYQLHSLDRIIRPDMSELEKISALNLHTYRFLEGGAVPGSEAENVPSALVITKNRREKGIGGTSATYAALLCQLALSAGYNARLVGMHTLDDSGKPITHDICEVYLDTYLKWVAFDPFSRATYYLRGSTPLSALDIHTSLVEGRIREISPVSAVAALGDIVSLREQILPRYRYLYLWRMNDILGKSPRGGSIPWQTLYQSHLVWEDRYSSVSKGGFDKVDRFANGGVKYVTHTRTDFEWTLNVIDIYIQRSGKESIKLYYTTVTPNFDHFAYTINDKPAKAMNINEYKDPYYAYSISSVNAFGVKGVLSAVEFSFQ